MYGDRKYLEENPVYWCRVTKKYIKYLKKIEPKINNIRYKCTDPKKLDKFNLTYQ